MFYLKKLLSGLILPPAGLIILAGFGLWLARRHPRTGRSVAGVALLVLLGLSLPPVGDALLHSLEKYPPLAAPDLARAQAIVVLGGGTRYAPEYGSDRTTSHATLERVRYGNYLQKRSHLPLLVTGGAPLGGRPEAEVMKEVVENDFQGKVKWVEATSNDTAENAVFSARLLKEAGIRRIALVSQAWHLPRAMTLFEQQGLEVIPAPLGFAPPRRALIELLTPSAKALNDSSTALHEWLGLLVQRLHPLK